MIDKLRQITALDIYPASVQRGENGTYFLGRKAPGADGSPPAGEKLVGCADCGEGACLPNVRKVGEIDGKCVCVGPCGHENAAALRKLLPWSAPRCLGLATSAGFGDRLGLATPGHIRAVRGTGIAPVLAQQSIREMTRTARTPEQVMDCATYGSVQEGFTDGFGSDADHLQDPQDIAPTVAAGFTQFTIDPGAHVDNAADTMPPAALAENLAALDYETLATSPGDLRAAYAGKTFALAGGQAVSIDELAFLRAAAKYGRAVAHTVVMFRRLQQAATRPFELEVSVDETDTPTTAAEHYFFASELRRLGVTWVAMAPRFIGRFEKGVDYIGSIDAFAADFARHVAVMRTLGPYKMSIHSGSDKFSIYPVIAELTGGLVHLKTAGTSYLEAVRTVAGIDPGLFRQIYDFARQHYDADRKTYHVSAEMSKVPPAAAFSDGELAGRIDDFHTRQALHCTFGSVLTADGGRLFRDRILAALNAGEQAHYANLAAHLGRHLKAFRS